MTKSVGDQIVIKWTENEIHSTEINDRSINKNAAATSFVSNMTFRKSTALVYHSRSYIIIRSLSTDSRND